MYNLPVIHNVESIINYMSTSSLSKKVKSFEIKMERTDTLTSLILIVKLPWYYIGPLGSSYREVLEESMQAKAPFGVEITIKKYN